MRTRVIALVAVAALFGVIWYLARNQAVPSPPQSSAGRSIQAPSASESPAFTESPPPREKIPASKVALPTAPSAPPKPAIPPISSVKKRELANPLAPGSFPDPPGPRSAESEPEVAAELDKVALMLRDYRTMAGENPVGSNAEIMKALTGGNERGAKFGPPEGMSLNGEGELVDHWGTPFFFHQLGRDLMEVHSAGPDRRMGTEDDVVLK